MKLEKVSNKLTSRNSSPLSAFHWHIKISYVEHLILQGEDWAGFFDCMDEETGEMGSRSRVSTRTQIFKMPVKFLIYLEECE